MRRKSGGRRARSGKPGVLPYLLESEPFLRVLIEESHEEGLALVADGHTLGKGHSFLLDLLEEVVRVMLLRKGHGAKEEGVEGYPKRPNISLVPVIRVARAAFGREVMESPCRVYRGKAEGRE